MERLREPRDSEQRAVPPVVLLDSLAFVSANRSRRSSGSPPSCICLYSGKHLQRSPVESEDGLRIWLCPRPDSDMFRALLTRNPGHISSLTVTLELVAFSRGSLDRHALSIVAL